MRRRPPRTAPRSASATGRSTSAKASSATSSRRGVAGSPRVVEQHAADPLEHIRIAREPARHVEARRERDRAVERDAAMRSAGCRGCRNSSPAAAPSRRSRCPSAKSTSPAATAAAEPLDEPPGTRSGHAVLSGRAVVHVLARQAVGELVRQGACRPCRRQRRASAAPPRQFRSPARWVRSQSGLPKPVRWPATSNRSLTAKVEAGERPAVPDPRSAT